MANRHVQVLLLTLLSQTASAQADAGAPRPSARPVVAVLYFDNQTTDRAFDVLQKGLADMMVTDLVSSDTVDVVERERFQAVIDELNLQRTKYFDPATAQRLGRMLGASHAVTGAIQEVKDTLRLSVRVIDLTSDVVPVAQDVFGPKDRIFELQERLMVHLLSAMHVKLGTKPPVTPVTDVGSLLAYSRAVDEADKGDLSQASARLGELLEGDQHFALGKDKRTQWARQLRAARDVRAQSLERERRALLARADRVLASKPPSAKSGGKAASRWLTYRVIRAQCLALAVEAQLTPKQVHNIRDGAEATVHALLAAYLEALGALDRDLTARPSPWKWAPDAADAEALEALGLKPAPQPLLANVPGVVRRWVGQVQLLGFLELAAGSGVLFRPTPCEADPSLVDGAARAMDEAAALLSNAPARELPEEQVVRTLDSKALGLFLAGRKDDAVHTWQTVLERFPKSRQYEQVERKLKDALQLTPAAQAEAEDKAALAKALEACDAERVQDTLDAVAQRRYDDEGVAGVKALFAQVDRTCAEREGFQPAVEFGAFLVADYAERHGDCGLFEKMAERYARLRPERLDKLRRDHPGCPP